MRAIYPFLLPLLLLAACHRQPTPAELPRVSWQLVDTVFSYHLVRGGGPFYKRGGLLGLQLLGGIDKKRNVFVPLDPGDSVYADMVTKISYKLLTELLAGKISKNAEGYIKADLSRILPMHPVVLTAYLSAGADSAGLDSLTRHLDHMPEVIHYYYISKDEAKKQFLADGNPDFTKVLDTNPLPASLEITVRDNYVSKDTLLLLKQKLESDNPLLISEVTLPSRLYTELRKIAVQDCVFRFKT
jgi:FtsX extracellular domain